MLTNGTKPSYRAQILLRSQRQSYHTSAVICPISNPRDVKNEEPPLYSNTVVILYGVNY